MSNVQHSSVSNEWYTPPEIVEAARKCMGSIDLDPASSDAANKIIKAERIFTIADDGLSQKWYGNILLNPPGGRPPIEVRRRFKSGSNAVCWWRYLVEQLNDIKQSIFIGFSLEILQAAQIKNDQWSEPLNFHICVPSRRLKFSGAGQPTHANVIVGVNTDFLLFTEYFEQFGSIKR